MQQPLFLCIACAVAEYNGFSCCCLHAIEKLGLSTIQRVTATLRQLAYGSPADANDKYIWHLREYCR
jgi:hypothetical protein